MKEEAVREREEASLNVSLNMHAGYAAQPDEEDNTITPGLAEVAEEGALSDTDISFSVDTGMIHCLYSEVCKK